MVYRKFNQVSKFQKAKVGLTAHVVLGSPKKNCAGIGICRIERAARHEDAASSPKRCCQAKALLTSKDDKLILYFVKHSLPACVLHKQFKNDHFPVDSEVFLPNEIALELGFRPGTFIVQGDYKVIDLGLHLCLAVETRSLNNRNLNWR